MDIGGSIADLMSQVKEHETAATFAQRAVEAADRAEKEDAARQARKTHADVGATDGGEGLTIPPRSVILHNEEVTA